MSLHRCHELSDSLWERILLGASQVSLLIENHPEYVLFQSITETAPLLPLSRLVKVWERQIPSEGKRFLWQLWAVFVLASCGPCGQAGRHLPFSSLPAGFPEPLPPLPEGHSVWWVKNKQVEGPPVLAVCVFSLCPGSVSGRAVTDKLFSLGASCKGPKTEHSSFCCLSHGLTGVLKPLFSAQASTHWNWLVLVLCVN